MRKLVVKKKDWPKDWIKSISGSNDYILGLKDIEQKPGGINIVSSKEPSLQKLLLKGRISQNQYNALYSGDRNDILLAFNIELMDMSDKIISDLVDKKGVEDFKTSEYIEVGE